ncbi:MAG TPA: hypothetical protein VGD65_21585 [Chryseosolibacter sp.]
MKQLSILCVFILLCFSRETLAGDLATLDSTIVVKHHGISDSIVVREFDEFIPVIHAESDPIVKYHFFQADSSEHHRAKAEQLDKEVNDGNLMIGNLNELTNINLPVGIRKQIGPLTYTIIFSKLDASTEGSFIEAYFMFEIPNTGDKIAFRGSNIPFSNTKGFTGRGRLDLIGDYHIVLNSSTLLTIIGKGKSFVEFDCDGFAGMSLEAGIEFSRDLIIPEDENGKTLPAPARVKTNFVTQIQNWNDILVGINLPNFQVNGLKDVSFNIHNAFLDWSDLMNPSGIQFPSGYASPFLESGQPSLWQGIYIQHLNVKLPKSFAKKNSVERVTIGVQNMILDDQGFTGKVFAENVLSAGDMSGWAFTIQKVSIDLVVNDVRGFEVSGGISVPGLRKTAKDTVAEFSYLAHRGADGNYLFAVTVGEQVKMPFLMADLNLRAGSMLTVVEKNDKFFPTAKLSGSLSITNAKAAIKQITFEGLTISSEEPKFDIQSVGFGNSGNQKVSDFPVVIKSIGVERAGGKIGLGIDLTVNIGGSPEEGGFGGGGKVTVWAKKEVREVRTGESGMTDTDSRWVFDKVEIGAIEINAKKPNAFELAGRIEFFEDSVYGKGFQGTVTGKLGKVGPISVNALFGKTSSFRYWYADALVKLPTRLPIVPSVMFANAFGGGFYYKMRQTAQKPDGLIGSFSQTPNNKETTVYYVPDANSMGIKAIMGIESVRKEAMNGTVMLELMMNRHGGINSVTLTGNADFMFLADLGTNAIKDLAGGAASGQLASKLGQLPKGQVNGNVRLSFDNVNDVFHGSLEVFINVAGGMVRGVGANSRAGWAVLHFEKDDWYIHIGTPTDPLGLEVARIFQSRSYFMLGKNLPGSPPPPSQVTEILGNVDLDYMRDMNALESGAGFAFGLHFIVDTGELKFLMFYGRFAAGTGVDFMLKDYGSSYHCQGSSGPMGINGWYANGQAYAFVMGKIGVKVNLKFYKGNFDIMNIGAAAILQAKGPNPFWMKGTVGGYYSILGGMVKGNCRFDVEVGEKCVPVGEQNVLADQQMIAEISPADGATKVDVFTNPQVAFNIPVGEVFEITDHENRRHYFRATLQQFDVAQDGAVLEGAQQWNDDKNVVIFDGHEILPGEKRLTVSVKLKFEERLNGNWQTLVFQGKPVEETKVVNFVTEKAPDYIPAHNVLVSYPLQDQQNFYPKEYNRGLIQLKDGQGYLFTPDPRWVQRVRMTRADGSSIAESQLDYNSSLKQVAFEIPTGLTNSQLYNFEIVNVPKSILSIDANVQNVETQVGGDDGTAVLTTKDIEGQLARLEVKSIYSARFRTSKYNTFNEKLKNIQLGQGSYVWQWLFVGFMQAWINGDESFSPEELSGTTKFSKLISMEADLQNTPWYTSLVEPTMYQGYPYLSILYVSRSSPYVFGIPPTRDITIEQVTASNQPFSSNAAAIPFNKHFVSYNIMRQVENDYYAMQGRAGNYLVDHPTVINSRLSHFLINAPPYIRYGNYALKLSYRPPGAPQPTSSFDWNLFNNIR